MIYSTERQYFDLFSIVSRTRKETLSFFHHKQYSAAFEHNTTSDWLNRMVWPIRSCVAFKFTKSWKKRQRMSFRMVGEYEPKANLSYKAYADKTTEQCTTNF